MLRAPAEQRARELQRPSRPVLMMPEPGVEPGIAGAYLKTLADLAAQSDGGDTALHFAARAGQAPLVRWLLQHGADRTSKNNNNQTPLDEAVSARQTDVIALLKDASITS